MHSCYPVLARIYRTLAPAMRAEFQRIGRAPEATFAAGHGA